MKSDDIRNTSVLYIGHAEDDLLQLAKEKACSILGTSMERLIGHQDYLSFGLGENEKTIGVETAKDIIDYSYLTAAFDIKVIVIDHMDKMTVEAQNKLLKTIEEANVIIIGLAYEDNILSTLKSRMQVIRICNRKRVLSNDVQVILNRTRECLMNPHNGGTQNLFRVLGLVKEKDPQSFFAIYREFVPDLIDMMAVTIVDRQITNKKDYTGLLANLQRERTVCTNYRYSKDDFFALIVLIAENM